MSLDDDVNNEIQKALSLEYSALSNKYNKIKNENIEDWKKRLILEYQDLEYKFTNLCIFLTNFDNAEMMDEEDWDMLCLQRDIMKIYLGVLESRTKKHTDYFPKKLEE